MPNLDPAPNAVAVKPGQQFPLKALLVGFSAGWILIWGNEYISAFRWASHCANGCQTQPDQGIELLLLPIAGWPFTLGLAFMAPLFIVRQPNLTIFVKILAVVAALGVILGFGIWPWAVSWFAAPTG